MPQTAEEILDDQFLLVRAKLLEIAAVLDRMDSATGRMDEDTRYQHIQNAIQILSSNEPNRAELIQRLMSRDYDQNWSQEFGLPIER